ncbi:MAG: SDR family oxidoreductase [Betaproteobacteria bacterium]|nr:SDR family oxidoreductase [Betaproteobacteria bacterium]
MATYPELKGRVAVISGAAQGIGASTAREFAKQHAHLALIDIDEAAAQKVAAEIQGSGARAMVVRTDVTDDASVSNALAKVAAEYGGIDIVVNSAGGYGKLTSVEELPLDDWDKTVALNMRGTFLMCKRAIPYLKKSKAGRIINVSSISGRTLFGSTSPAYAASKAGVIQLTRFLAIELGPCGITANSIAPITTLTPRVRALRSEANIEQIASQIPLRRLPDPEDHANAMVFLASDSAAYLNGVALDINGGRILM